MATTALSAFRPRVAILAATATDPMIDQAVLDSCIDFCERTLVLRRQLTGFPTVAGTPGYTPALPAESAVVTYLRVWADATELVPLDDDGIGTPAGFLSAVPGQTTVPGMPRYFNTTDPGSIQLYPAPDAVYTVNARVALRPTRAATAVDSQLFEDWVEAITSGALARLYATPGELLNPGLAKLHAGSYESQVGSAQLQASRTRARTDMSVRPVHI